VALAASIDGDLSVYDVQSGREVLILRGQGNNVGDVSLSADGKVAVSGYEDGKLRVWDLSSEWEIGAIEGHTKSVHGVALSADGKVVISGSLDGTVKVWDVNSGTEIRTLRGHTNWVNRVALSTDAMTAVSASNDCSLRVWDVESGACLTTFSCEDKALSCALGPNVVVAGDAAGRVYFLDIERGHDTATGDATALHIAATLTPDRDFINLGASSVPRHGQAVPALSRPEGLRRNESRRIRVFVSSTFRDMAEERNELMSQTWPELRRFCCERQVELVEVDMRWGISEGQSTRKETLKLCLNEVRACRPFFIGLLGERYGWTPGNDSFTADLKEEQPWLGDLSGKSVTELEILHGVLNDPEMADRSFFYLRDPAYAQERGADFLSENADDANKQVALKMKIRATCAARKIRLYENYPDPRALATLVQGDLKEAIKARFPVEEVPDRLTHEARDHDAFAETRRRTYIGRPDYFARLDRHAEGDSGPLVVLGESGSGKSALLANWVERWRKAHPDDFTFEHYIGSTPDSADHWRLMTRLIGEIKRWTNDPEDLPLSHDDLLRDFPVWLAKARIKAAHNGVRCIILLDALNQIEDRDHARLLGWLPSRPLIGALRLMASTLPVNRPNGEPDKAVDDRLNVVADRGWESLRVEPLKPRERYLMIARYLKRFGKKLDKDRLKRLAIAPPARNPLYLKILLDELRVTGTHHHLDERLDQYLAAPDIPALLKQVLVRYKDDYERDRPGLVSEALGLIWAARRGLSETEILRLLKPTDLPQLPMATWSPLRAALEEGLVDRGGILNFAHDFLRVAVEAAFLPDVGQRDKARLRLADEFAQQPASSRSCDELPWLLSTTKQRDRLRACLLDVDRFLEIFERDPNELLRYWVDLGEERTMGEPYFSSFDEWSKQPLRDESRISFAASNLAFFLNDAALYSHAELLMRRALAIWEQSFGAGDPKVASGLNNLAQLLKATNRLAEVEPLLRRALAIEERSYGPDHPNVTVTLHNLASLLYDTNRLAEAEPLMRRALGIDEVSLGSEHPKVAIELNNLASLLLTTNRPAEAEPLLRRALAIDERNLGPDDPKIARDLNNLAGLLESTNRLAEAEPLMRRMIPILERGLGYNHPDLATALDNLASLLQATNRLAEAEPLRRRALAIDERSFGPDHPKVAIRLNNLANLLQATNRLAEAEPQYRRALAINEQSYGPDHPEVGTDLDNLASLLQAKNQMAEAEPLMRRAPAIDERSFGPDHPKVAIRLNNLARLLQDTNRLAEAEPLLRRVVEILEANDPRKQPIYAGSLSNLALLLQATNRLAEAEPLLRRALAIDEESHGPDHPDVAIRLNNLAGILQATNRLAETEPLMRRVISIFEKSLGEGHPSVATGLNNLAQLLQDTSRLAEAEPLMRRALAIDEQSCGPNHPSVARDLNNYAVLLQATNRLPEAEPLMRRALTINEHSYGLGHPEVATGLNNLALLLQAAGRLAEAEPLMRRALEVLLNFTWATGHSHASLRTFANNYGRLLEAMGRDHGQIPATLLEMAPELFQ
jgi:tetratricopeptide (TPR) repeat protein